MFNLNNINKLREIINNRTVILMFHGKSIEELEYCIEELKELDVCYASLNCFEIMENFILSKINKQLDYVYDSADVEYQYLQNFNAKLRIPRLNQYLSRNKNNLWITAYGVIRNLIRECGYEDFVFKYLDKVLLIDYLNINFKVPSSSFLLIGLTAICNPEKIILCGFDGYKGSIEKNIDSYYKKEIYKKQRLLATGSLNKTNIIIDTKKFEVSGLYYLKDYCNRYKIEPPKIYNCSLKSHFTIFPKISYKDLKKVILEG